VRVAGPVAKRSWIVAERRPNANGFTS
jgi:hypothetical protein